jgi:hypothetical protein
MSQPPLAVVPSAASSEPAPGAGAAERTVPVPVRLTLDGIQSLPHDELLASRVTCQRR